MFTLVMAIAAISTAWASFESSHWSSRQSASTTQASMLRMEANRAYNEASQLRTLDVISFTQWVNALNIEMQTDPSVYPARGYTPRKGTASGFLFARFRKEFRPAVDAWLATRPLGNPDAPSTPFAMPEYHLAVQAKADQLAEEAEKSTANAAVASALSSQYALTGLLFALVVFFAAVGSKTIGRLSHRLLLALSTAILIGTLIVLARLAVTL